MYMCFQKCILPPNNDDRLPVQQNIRDNIRSNLSCEYPLVQSWMNETVSRE